MSAPTNESFEIKRVEMIAAACTAAFMHQLGGQAMPRIKDAWEARRFQSWLHADRWRRDDQVIDFHHDSHDHRKSEYVLFSNPFYAPESDFVEGTPKLLQDVELQVDGLTKISITARTPTPFISPTPKKSLSAIRLRRRWASSSRSTQR